MSWRGRAPAARAHPKARVAAVPACLRACVLRVSVAAQTKAKRPRAQAHEAMSPFCFRLRAQQPHREQPTTQEPSSTLNFCSLAAVPTCGVHSVFRSDPKRREQGATCATARGCARGRARRRAPRSCSWARSRGCRPRQLRAACCSRAVSPPRAPLLDQEPGGVSSASAHAATARVQVRARAGRPPSPRPGTRCDRARGADRKHQPPRPSRACPSRSLYSASLGRDPQESLQPAQIGRAVV